jgi:hypothetical protein
MAGRCHFCGKSDNEEKLFSDFLWRDRPILICSECLEKKIGEGFYFTTTDGLFTGGRQYGG